MKSKSGSRRAVIFLLLFSVTLFSFGCSTQKIPIILDHPPKDVPYEAIGPVLVDVNWHALQWLWFWWHYLPWYPSVYKIHDKALIKKAQKMGADAIINVEYLPKRAGATGEAIRFKTT